MLLIPPFRSKRIYLIGILCLGLLVAAGVVLASSKRKSSLLSQSESTTSNTFVWLDQNMQPKITWSEAKLEITLSPGESQTKNLTFKSNLALNNIAVESVSSLANFVQIQPGTLPTVPANQEQNVKLFVSIPPGIALGTYEGTIHIRNNNQTVPQTLKLTINVWTISQIIDGVTLKSPPNWFVRTDADVVTISNVATAAKLSDAALQAESFFYLRKLRDVNTESVPIDQWFDQYFSGEFPSEPTSKTLAYVDNHAAVSIETSEIGGKHRHIYVFDGHDVFEISYGLFASQFNTEYSTILGSIDIPN